MTDPRMTTNDAPVTVEQCDREAALSTVPDDGSHSSYMMAEAIEAGRADEWPLVQAFARHRLAALASAPAGDGVEEAIKMAIAEGIGEYVMPGAPYDAAVGKVVAALPRPRAAVGERDEPKSEPEAWGDRECSGCTLPRRDCECN